MDFSFNDLADVKFQYYDAALLEAVKLGTPQVCSFFRLLALCHTVMPDETNNGKCVCVRERETVD